MTPRPQRSIVRQLVLVTIVVGLLVGSSAVALVLRGEADDLRAAAAAGTLATAQRTATLIDGRVEGLIDQLTLLASRPSVTELDPDAGTELAVALRVSDDIDDLVLRDRRGRAVAAASSVELLTADDLPDDDLMVELARTGPAVRILHEDRLPHLELTVAVEDPPGRLVGALTGTATVQLLTHEADARLLSSDATGLLVSFDGRIVGHRELDRVIAGERYEPAQALAEGREDVTVVDFEDGRGPVIIAAARSRVMPVWMMVELPEADALASSERVVDATWLVVLAVVIAIVAAVIVASRRFLRPLRPLAVAVERLGSGELDVRVDQDPGTGEVQVVATGFNRMAERLADRQRELERAEEAARRSEERLRLMVEAVEDYAIFLLTPGGRIRTWNAGARRLLGPDAQAAKGRHLRSFFDPDEPPPDPWEQARRSGRGESEGWYRRDDGTRFFADAVVTALGDVDGDATSGFAVVLHDATARRAAREAIEHALAREREAAEELRRTNELKDGFLAMAAHELQTPLAAIMGANEILKDPDGLTEHDRDQLRTMIEQHTADMREIVQRLLDFSRLQAGRVRLNPERVPLRGELERHVDRLEHRLGDHDVVVDAPSATVELDRRSLQHILSNLLTNAAKFSDPGTRIEITGLIEDGHVELTVTDHGIGVREEDRDDIFELFTRAHGDGGVTRGTGVGLAIVKRYTDLLGGTVTLESEIGRGSTFTITIPQPLPVSDEGG